MKKGKIKRQLLYSENQVISMRVCILYYILHCITYVIYVYGGLSRIRIKEQKF